MFFLMLDPRFKTFHFVSLLIGHEQSKANIEEYDKKSLFPMFLKCHYHLHLLVEYERGVVDLMIEENNNLDIFEMIINTSELAIELINKELLIFMHYQVNVKDIKCPLQWWEKHDNMFLIVGFCARQILRIVGS